MSWQLITYESVRGEKFAERSYEAWAFVFHPSFERLHRKMKTHFHAYRAKGYPFTKNFWNIPVDYEEVFLRRGLSYDHYDEVLALLRGYEKASTQKLIRVVLEGRRLV